MADEWILNRFNILTNKVTAELNSFNFSMASDLLREFTWSDFADWYLEIAKIEKDKDEILLYVFRIY